MTRDPEVKPEENYQRIRSSTVDINLFDIERWRVKPRAGTASILNPLPSYHSGKKFRIIPYELTPRKPWKGGRGTNQRNKLGDALNFTRKRRPFGESSGKVARKRKRGRKLTVFSGFLTVPRVEETRGHGRETRAEFRGKIARKLRRLPGVRWS